MNILINYVGKKGGGPVYAYCMAKELIKNGHNVYLVTADNIENRNYWEQLKLAGSFYVKGYKGLLSFLFSTIRFRLFGVKRIKKYFKDIELDASYHPMETLWGGIIDKNIKAKKYIVTMHDPIAHSTSQNDHNFLKRLFLVSDKKKMTDAVILSSCFVDTVKETFKLPEERIHVIKHGNFDYYFDICDSKYEYDLNVDCHFLFFGRIDKYKGLHVLAKAYQKLVKEENVDLTIVGNGDFSDYKSEYDALPRCKVINRWIKDEEVASFFVPKNVVVVLPYTDATQSGVIPIAQSAKKLIVAARTGGLCEQVEENKECLMFEPSNADDLYLVMKKAVKEKDNQDILNNSKEKVFSLSWDKSAMILESAIKE